MKTKFNVKYIVLIAIIIGTIFYFSAPVHKYNIEVAKTWWEGWLLSAQTNLYPNERGLNVAVFDSNGNFIESNSFDTYYYADSGFSSYIDSVSRDSWVVIAAMGEAATNLTAENILTLENLGGSDQLIGKYNWAYILVGYNGLGEGNGAEWLDEKFLHIKIDSGTIIGDLLMPVNMNIYSMGFYADLESYAFISVGNMSFKNLEYWIDVVKGRI